MSGHYWDPQSTNGDNGQHVAYPYMRVGSAGELAFYNGNDPLFELPELVIAPGQWKVAWRDEDE